MNSPREMQRLRCPSCGWQTLCGLEELLRRLRTMGMLRREAQPSEAMIRELAVSQLPKMPCDQCHHHPLILEDVPDDFDDWGTGRLCDLCGRPLAPERLELYPNARRCSACEQVEVDSTDAEYCPRCGGPLMVKPDRGRSLARYRLTCRDCGYQGR